MIMMSCGRQRRFVRVLLLAGAALWTHSALAQGPNSQSAADGDAPTAAGDGEQTIVVVGSRTGNLAEGALPVSIADRQELDSYGAVNVGELVSYIPSVGDVEFTDNNTGTNGARGDVAAISLRGLGSGNTLNLIDGRRMVTHPLSQAIDDAPVTFANVNAIPSSSIQRVEVLRDGASALYGADATAGVVNFVTFDDYDGLALSARYGMSSLHSMDEFDATLRAGTSFNGGRTRINVGGTYYHRSDAFYTELPGQFATLDDRLLVPDAFLNDTQFDNRSTIGPFGRYTSGRQNANGSFTNIRVRQGTTSLTSTAGLFYVAPNPSGTGTVIRSGSQPRDLRYDFIRDEIVIPRVERWNGSVGLTHEFSPALEFFSSLSYYNSNSLTQRAPGPFDRALALIVIPARNYYNPFGPVGSPNRLPGIDAPAQGLDIVIEGYRNLEIGPRIIEVDQESWRALAGLRGTVGIFDWESAFLYSEAHARDEEFNRTSKNLLQQQASLTTPNAFNFFGGPFVNSQAVLDAVRISSVREGESTLALADLRVTSDQILTLPAGAIGFAAGVEWRRETIFDDSDPRLDGTVTFTAGLVPDESDVVGVSATSDFGGSRNVISAYAEAVVPLVSEAMSVPLIHRLDLQLAGRVERGNDFDLIFAPKIGVHWFLTSWLSLRGAYGEGFRAPNLVQLNQGTITRRAQGDTDFYRANVTATQNDIGNTYRPSLRQGNPDLQPERSETWTAGVVFQPARLLPGLTVSVDYFRFEQRNLVGTFGVEEQLAFDFLERMRGGSNPNVIRATATPEDVAAFNAYNAANPNATRMPVGEVLLVLDSYVNLDPRTVEGLDFSISYRLPRTRLGQFRLDASATHLLEFEQRKDSIAPLLADPVLGPSFASVAPDRRELNGNPRWRATGTLNWSLDRYSASVTVRHISGVFDTSATQDQTGEFFRVEDWTTANLRFAINLGREGTALWGTELAVGAINVFNSLPPQADESAGYFDSLHNVRGRVIYGSVRKEF